MSDTRKDVPSFLSRVYRRLGFELRHSISYLNARCKGNPIDAYWYNEIVNFGDLITPMVLRHYGYSPVFQKAHRAKLISTGSILEHIPNNYSGTILGSGFIDETCAHDFPMAKILAVRGELTRSRLGRLRSSVELGDPGLLASELIPNREQKKYVLGIVPHYSERDDPRLKKIGNLSTDIILINVTSSPLEVFSLIDQCQYILSSSLHGLIVSDSFGIPNCWLAPRQNSFVKRYKFDDYYSSLKMHRNPLCVSGHETLSRLIANMVTAEAELIEEKKARLNKIWISLFTN